VRGRWRRISGGWATATHAQSTPAIVRLDQMSVRGGSAISPQNAVAHRQDSRRRVRQRLRRGDVGPVARTSPTCSASGSSESRVSAITTSSAGTSSCRCGSPPASPTPWRSMAAPGHRPVTAATAPRLRDAGRTQGVNASAILALPFAVLRTLDYERAGFDTLKRPRVRARARSQREAPPAVSPGFWTAARRSLDGKLAD
jgi:hypothetical protein